MFKHYNIYPYAPSGYICKFSRDVVFWNSGIWRSFSFKNWLPESKSFVGDGSTSRNFSNRIAVCSNWQPFRIAMFDISIQHPSIVFG